MGGCIEVRSRQATWLGSGNALLGAAVTLTGQSNHRGQRWVRDPHRVGQWGICHLQFWHGQIFPRGYFCWDDGIDDGGTGLDLTTDPHSLVYVAGGVYEEGWNDDYFTRVYSPDGDVIWEQGYTGIAQVSRDVATHIALDATGEIYVTGTSGYDVATLNYGAVPQPLMIDIGNLYTRELVTGTIQAVFDVRLSQPQDTDITFDYTTVEGTAVPGQDYLSASGSVTIPAGHTFATFEVPVLGDALKEPDEFFFITLSNPSQGTFRNGQVRAVIWDSSNLPHFLPLTLR